MSFQVFKTSIAFCKPICVLRTNAVWKVSKNGVIAEYLDWIRVIRTRNYVWGLFSHSVMGLEGAIQRTSLIGFGKLMTSFWSDVTSCYEIHNKRYLNKFNNLTGFMFCVLNFHWRRQKAKKSLLATCSWQQKLLSPRFQ